MTIQQTANEVARLGSRLSTLKGLPDVEDVTTPIPTAVADYYANNIAGGSGPDGTYVIADFFGAAAGVPYNQSFDVVNSFIETNPGSVLADLSSIYADMGNVVDSTYGVPPTITIPLGPAAGVYATYDAALVALVTAANNEIGNIIAAVTPDTVTELNTAWQDMATNLASEDTNRDKAGIDYANMQSNYQLVISAFIPGIGALGTNTEQGGSAQLFEGLANVANQYGQAFVGAMREGRNKQGLENINVGVNTGIPSQLPEVPPQAPLASGSYTVAEARARIQSTT